MKHQTPNTVHCALCIVHHTLNIRHLLSLFLCLLSLFLCPLSLYAASPTISSQPTVQNLQPTEATIVWTSANTTMIHGWLEYGTPTLGSTHAFEQVDGQITCFTNIYRVRLTNLQPGTTYQYRAFCRLVDSFTGYTTLNFGDTLATDVYSFTTPTTEEKEVSALIYSHILGKTTLYSSLLSDHGLNVDDYDLVLLNGDLLATVTGAKSLTTYLLSPISKLLKGKTPYFIARGDAEYRNSFSRSLSQYFYTPGTIDRHPFYYSFTWGPCFFIVLDSGDSGEGADEVYRLLNVSDEYMQQQVAWLQQTLASEACTTAKHIVVVRHHANPTLDNELPSLPNLTLITGTSQASVMTLNANETKLTIQTYE